MTGLLARHDGTAGVIRAAAVGAVVSGAPSMTIALRRGRLGTYAREAVDAAAAVGGAADWPLAARVPIAAGVHGGLSLAWAGVIAAVLPARRPLRFGAAAGLMIAALDLGVVGRRIPAVRRLDPLPQVLDHVAFGLAVAATLTHPHPRSVSAASRYARLCTHRTE